MKHAVAARKRLKASILLAAFLLLLGFLALEAYVHAHEDVTEAGEPRFGKYALRPYVFPLARAQEARERILNGSPQYLIPDSRLGWRPAPNARFSLPSHSFETNSIGLRNPREFAVQKPAGVLRIAAFGDSYVHGDEVNYDQTWIALAEQALAARMPAEIMNFGVGGYGIDQAYLYWKLVGRDYRPNIILIGYQPENCRRNVNIIRAFYNQPIAFSKPRFVLKNNTLRQLPGFPIDPLELESVMRAFPSNISQYEYLYDPQDYDTENLLYKSRLVSLARSVKDDLFWAHKDSVFYTPGAPEAELCHALLRTFAEEASRESRVYFVRMLPREYLKHAHRKGTSIDDALVERLRQHAPVIDTTPALLDAARTSSVNALYRSWHYTPQANAVVADAIARALLRDINNLTAV